MAASGSLNDEVYVRAAICNSGQQKLMRDLYRNQGLDLTKRLMFWQTLNLSQLQQRPSWQRLEAS